MFLYGLLFGSGPCLASCGPILISYIAGTKKSILKSLLAYILFSLARISIYLILGIGVFFLGSFGLERLLGGLSKYIIFIGSCFIILIGMLMIAGNRFEYKACCFLQKKILGHDKKSIIILGLIMGLLPCAPLIAIISYSGLVSRSWLQSLFYTFFFGLGTFVSPLVLLTFLSGLIGRWMNGKRYYRVFNSICGLIIVFLGVQLLTRILR